MVEGSSAIIYAVITDRLSKGIVLIPVNHETGEFIAEGFIRLFIR